MTTRQYKRLEIERKDFAVDGRDAACANVDVK
jgi:hypothetical protein